MAYDPLNDPEDAAFRAELSAAEDKDISSQLAADIGERREQAEHPVRRFVTNLPKNIGIGAWKALYNTVDTISDVAAEANPQALAAKAVGGEEMRKLASPSLSEQYPEFMNSLRHFTDQWERNDTMSDDVSQGVAQFALPFMGWMKLAGGVSGASKALVASKALAVEAGTAASAFDPHDGRVADLLEMGRESETRFGTLLRQVAPDDSLVNQYIDYMTDRAGEGEAEGRWKNAVDAVVSSAAVAGVLKGAAGAYKFGKFALEDAGISSFGPKNQKGMIAFHGSQQDFEKFDLSKIGTGEGAQAYGYGLYFAQSPGVAKSYKTAGGPYLEFDGERVFAEEWDGLPIKGTVKDLVLEGSRHGLKDDGVSMFVEREIKRNPERWGLKNRKEQMDALDLARKTKAVRGKFYEVDIDDASVEKMLDYDTELSQQPHILKKIPVQDREVLEEMLDERGYSPDLEAFSGNELQQMIGRAIQEDRILFDPPDGNFDNLKKLAAGYLQAHDIPGVKYLDQGSRKKSGNYAQQDIDEAIMLLREKTGKDPLEEWGYLDPNNYVELAMRTAEFKPKSKYEVEGTRNFVLFDDKLVKITKKE